MVPYELTIVVRACYGGLIVFCNSAELAPFITSNNNVVPTSRNMKKSLSAQLS